MDFVRKGQPSSGIKKRRKNTMREVPQNLLLYCYLQQESNSAAALLHAASCRVSQRLCGPPGGTQRAAIVSGRCRWAATSVGNINLTHIEPMYRLQREFELALEAASSRVSRYQTKLCAAVQRTYRLLHYHTAAFPACNSLNSSKYAYNVQEEPPLVLLWSHPMTSPPSITSTLPRGPHPSAASSPA